MKRDFVLFENIKAIESTLTKAIFIENNAEGTWTVSQDDIYASYCKNKSFFILETSKKSGKAPASQVLFKIKDYDLVGPKDFHDDRSFDKSRDEWDRPWF